MAFDADPRSMGTLLSDAINQITRLVRGEIALAKAEVAQNVRNAGMGIGLVLGAVVLAFLGLNVLAGAAVAALATLVGPGWAALIVGVAILGIAALLALRGISALRPENLAPHRTVANVQADVQTIKENVSNGHQQL